MSQDGGYEMKPAEKPAVGAGPAGPDSPAAGGAEAEKGGGTGWEPSAPVMKARTDERAAEATDIEKHKGLAILGYVCFIVPLAAAPNSKFARFHANQGLLVFITLVAVVMAVALLQAGKWVSGHLLGSIPILDGFFWCGFSFFQAALLVGWVALVIMGIVDAANGEKKALPVVGHWTLIK